MPTGTARFVGKPWWQMPNAGRPRQWSVPGEPGKGAFGGICFRVACDRSSAHWFNETNGRYYCVSCAKAFNEVSQRHGQRPLCELHL